MGEVLDVCCGSKMFWFNKHEPHTTYCDKRTVPYHEYYPNRFLEVRLPLSEVLKAIGRNPLYGNRSGKHMTTHWLAFVKFADEANDVQTLF